MAKETMIIFIYDTECLKNEADDPVNAVLYFHPSWVSNTQKVALCGQLMGTSHFLKDCFFKPKIIALQNGKFVLKEFGRFTLAVGTDRNISDQLLQQRADLLTSFINFFHRDLQMIYDQFSQQHQYKNLSDKLYHIFETYIPILQRSGNIFHNIPKLRLPKTASNIFLDAIQTLQCCQQTKGILGGVILYHNKVVASQLEELTKHLVLSDPLHIRMTAEQIHSTEFRIPNGVQIIVVYIEEGQYAKLAADAERAQNLQTIQLFQSVLPFQFAKRKLKRDKSLIFTHIPEEGMHPDDSQAKGEFEVIDNQSHVPKSFSSRPNYLPLRLKSANAKDLPESGIASINFDETDSYPEFIGRTSVCSTPMTENKVLPVGSIMSICVNNEEKQQSPEQKRNSLKFDIQSFLSNSTKNLERRNSLNDLQDSFKRISKKLSLKQFSNSFKNDMNPKCSAPSVMNEEALDYIENGEDEDYDLELKDGGNKYSEANNKISSTITDPTYPLVNANGQTISRSLFQELVAKYNKLWETQDGPKKDSDIAQLLEEIKIFDNELKKLDHFLDGETKDKVQPDCNLKSKELVMDSVVKSTVDKKSLCLPIKPLTDNNPPPVANRKLSGGIPLTPLMAKLSVLAANEDRTSFDNSGGRFEVQTPVSTCNRITSRRSSFKTEDGINPTSATTTEKSSVNNKLRRSELYICGQQNMTLLLLMEEGSSKQQSIIQKMFEICVAKFPQMESHLNQTLNINVDGDKRQGTYSFLCLDSKWDSVQRNGPWSLMELNTLECMHQDIQHDGEITDLILRTNENVFYGYKCGRTELFYKEPAHRISGVPPPSDPIGKVTAHAKSRLERDHSYILF